MGNITFGDKLISCSAKWLSAALKGQIRTARKVWCVQLLQVFRQIFSCGACLAGPWSLGPKSHWFWERTTWYQKGTLRWSKWVDWVGKDGLLKLFFCQDPFTLPSHLIMKDPKEYAEAEQPLFANARIVGIFWLNNSDQNPWYGFLLFQYYRALKSDWNQFISLETPGISLDSLWIFMDF